MGDQPRHLHRVLGGAPLAVLLRLVIVSVIIGAIMAGVGLTPDNLVQHALQAAEFGWHISFAALHNVGAYALMGAVIVVPIWIVMRVAGRS